MSQSQKMEFVVVMLIFCVGIFFFLGKIRYVINPIMRRIRLEQFITTVKKANTIDPEQFWEFRDFYAPTTSSFSPQNIPLKKPFLSFNTPQLESNDFLIPEDKDVKPPHQEDIQIIWSQKDQIIFGVDQKIYVFFIKSQKEMESANGFFRYFGTDITPYKDNYWYNETVISL